LILRRHRKIPEEDRRDLQLEFPCPIDGVRRKKARRTEVRADAMLHPVGSRRMEEDLAHIGPKWYEIRRPGPEFRPFLVAFDSTMRLELKMSVPL
jgi:hypothetical protein